MSADEEGSEKVVEGVVDGAKEKSSVKDRLFKLKLQYNAGRKANTKQVEQEYHNHSGKKFSSDEISDNSDEEKINKDEDNSKCATNSTKSTTKFKRDKSYNCMNMTANESEVKKEKESEVKYSKNTYGLNSLVEDHNYNAYTKGVDINLAGGAPGKRNSATIDEFSYGTTSGVTKAGLDKLTNDIRRKEEMRTKSNEKRNRLNYSSTTVDSINDNNALFNKRVKKSFDKYTVEIRQNLERGTAL